MTNSSCDVYRPVTVIGIQKQPKVAFFFNSTLTSGHRKGLPDLDSHHVEMVFFDQAELNVEVLRP